MILTKRINYYPVHRSVKINNLKKWYHFLTFLYIALKDLPLCFHCRILRTWFFITSILWHILILISFFRDYVFRIYLSFGLGEFFFVQIIFSVIRFDYQSFLQTTPKTIVLLADKRYNIYTMEFEFDSQKVRTIKRSIESTFARRSFVGRSWYILIPAKVIDEARFLVIAKLEINIGQYYNLSRWTNQDNFGSPSRKERLIYMKAKDFDKKFDKGEDITKYLDVSKDTGLKGTKKG